MKMSKQSEHQTDLDLSGGRFALGETKFLAETKNLDLSDNGLTSFDGVVLPEGLEVLIVRGMVFADKRWQPFNAGTLQTLCGATFPQSLKKLILYTNQIISLSEVRFPHLLETLDLENNRISSIIEAVFPDSLRELNLSYNYITSLQFVMFNDGLQKLNLSMNKVSAVQGLKFPSNLLYLNISGNNIMSLAGVTFPNQLQVICLSNNFITSLLGTIFPDSLQEAYFNSNQIESLLGVKFPNGLIKLDCNDNNITSLNNVKFPNRLKVLQLNDCLIESIRGVKFSEGLERLELGGNQISSLVGVVFPNQLQQLLLDYNKIYSFFNVVFPDSLEILICSDNPIVHLMEVQFSRNLKILDFEITEINSLVGVHFPSGLLSLDLSENSTLQSLQGFKCPVTLQELFLINSEVRVKKTDLKKLSASVITKIAVDTLHYDVGIIGEFNNHQQAKIKESFDFAKFITSVPRASLSFEVGHKLLHALIYAEHCNWQYVKQYMNPENISKLKSLVIQYIQAVALTSKMQDEVKSIFIKIEHLPSIITDIIYDYWLGKKLPVTMAGFEQTFKSVSKREAEIYLETVDDLNGDLKRSRLEPPIEEVADMLWETFSSASEIQSTMHDITGANDDAIIYLQE